jgi:hypothetical protein
MLTPNSDVCRRTSSRHDRPTSPSQISQVDAGAISTAGSSTKRSSKLLLLAWHFPPSHAIASVRTWNLAKYLARRGWQVTVLTPDPRLRRQLENPLEVQSSLSKEGIRRILTEHRWRWLVPYHLHCWNEGLGWLTGGICRKIADRVGIVRKPPSSWIQMMSI